MKAWMRFQEEGVDCDGDGVREIKSRKSPRLGSQEGEMVPAERVQRPKGWEGPGECRDGRGETNKKAVTVAESQ